MIFPLLKICSAFEMKQVRHKSVIKIAEEKYAEEIYNRVTRSDSLNDSDQ